MKKVLFVASLPTKKMNFDGERNKSRDVLKCIKNMGPSKIDIINYSKNKYLQSIKLLFKVMFKKYDYVFVSKCIVGGSIAIHIINKFGKKNSNLYFYLIGNGYDGFEDKTIFFSDLLKCKKIIIESPTITESLTEKGINEQDLVVFPCLKPNYDIKVLEKHYPVDGPLKLIFFSRINRLKGLDDLIDAVIKVNEKGTIKYNLDIAGGVSSEPEVVEFSKEVIDICNKYDYLNYLGLNLTIKGIDSYYELQRYDLHAFPSKFPQECAPGSILDMFIAGVPTLASTFPSAKFLMDENNSFFFKQGNKEDLIKKLEFIYNNQELLSKKRVLSHIEHNKYTEDAFADMLKSIGFVI